MSDLNNSNSNNSCCHPCHPCCIPYGQSSEQPCFASEVEAVPQTDSAARLDPSFQNDQQDSKKKRKKVAKFAHVELAHIRLKIITNLLPKTCITRKIVASVPYTTWDCCKRNGIQDETPQWLVLGKPYRRRGPSYRNCVAYFPH